ncbi:hypothetical protein GCM10009066_04040 [Halarchaeum salinum]|uniref:Uncharacterized protein n=2 Tax=Halarchaeum salinum TaxID=489912 RepID=A0AAV3S3R8_9EURY
MCRAGQDATKMETKTLAGLPLLVIAAALLLWTTLTMKTVSPMTLGAGAVAAVGLAVGSLLVGTAGDGRSV